MEAVWNGGLTFLTHSSLGLLIGGLLGWAAVLLMRWSRDPVLENAITVVLAYGSFIIASEESVSGVAAVIIAGIIVGATRWHDENADDSIQTISTFWESIDYIINSTYLDGRMIPQVKTSVRDWSWTPSFQGLFEAAYNRYGDESYLIPILDKLSFLQEADQANNKRAYESWWASNCSSSVLRNSSMEP